MDVTQSRRNEYKTGKKYTEEILEAAEMINYQY